MIFLDKIARPFVQLGSRVPIILSSVTDKRPIISFPLNNQNSRLVDWRFYLLLSLIWYSLNEWTNSFVYLLRYIWRSSPSLRWWQSPFRWWNFHWTKTSLQRIFAKTKERSKCIVQVNVIWVKAGEVQHQQGYPKSKGGSKITNVEVYYPPMSLAAKNAAAAARAPITVTFMAPASTGWPVNSLFK